MNIKKVFETNWKSWLPSRGNLLFTLLVALCLIAATTSGVLAAPQRMAAQAVASTATIPYQGRLADASGAPLTGTYIIVFRLYDVASGGAALWTESWTGADSVQVTNGLFNVLLGSLTPIPQSLLNSNSSLWLGIDVGSDPEMTPRVQLGSAPFAFQAQHADSASSLSGPGGSPANAVIVDGSGNVGIGTTNPTTKVQIVGQGDLLRLYNSDPATVSAGGVAFQLENIAPSSGGGNNWLRIVSYGDGYTGTLTSGQGGASLPLNRADVIHTDGEALIFANYLNKPFYFIQGAGGLPGPAYIPLTIAGNGNVGIGTTNPQGRLDVSGEIYQRGGLLHADYVFAPGYSLESIEDHAAYMWANKHLQGVPARVVNADGQEVVEIGAQLKGAVEELEKAHIYINQLNQRLSQTEARLAALERSGGASADPAGGWNLLTLAALAALIVYRFRSRPVRS